MKLNALGLLLLLSTAILVGCGESKPEMVADPNDYAPYQASPDELKAQQEAAKQQSGPPKY
ncbi:hypothetical protein FHS27_005050 [Rhodopirellula rubra]|uniref:Secreted protein n=1 Tax=Aporhodopirellula rubra TaxID=980271 RepID=A0A7W5H733_9BACT|nr:hypothetical protein [Aporhodopirellula rubra]MBB3209212.1 hypothetical protein [Aporhodopirellula rubra]